MMRVSLPLRQSNAPAADRVQYFADLVNKGLPKDAKLSEILNGVWKNEIITSQCPNLVIRLTSLRGEVSKRIWQNRGKDPKDIQILAVGTVYVPKHLASYHKFLERFFRTSAERSIAAASKANDVVIGYDLLSKGSDEARRSALSLMNDHYGFSEETLGHLLENSAITGGGMRGLKDIADACVLNAKERGACHRFVQPDNSFGTWWNIVEKSDFPVDNYRREIVRLEASPANKLHLTAEDVKNYYKQNNPSLSESWYITPVGNPSGTMMAPGQLSDTCKAILEYNPKASIILDTVYVRTLSTDDARKLTKDLVQDKKLLQNIVFLESFSKSHGLCRERLGMYFSANAQLFTKLHTANIAYSAGPGGFKDNQFLVLGQASDQDKAAIRDLHDFWKQERKGLYKYLMNEKNRVLFDDKQEHIRKGDLDNPCTLYILLKTKPNVYAQDVFVHTGALGVDTPLLSGHYVRFAVGQLTEPTYSKFA